MKKITFTIIMSLLVVVGMAQRNAPRWLENQRKAILQVTTYGLNDNNKKTGTAFFVSENGDALSSYSLFVGAVRAVVTDNTGKEYPVKSIVGADEMYDVIKFKVEISGKVPFLSIANEPLSIGTDAYLIPYVTARTGSFTQGAISEANTLKGSYGYYKVNIPSTDSSVDAPILNANGEVFGIAQEDATGKKEHLFAVSAGYVNSLQVSPLEMLDVVYTAIGIQKAWPDDINQALISLLLLSNQDAKAYLSILNDFITAFPDAPDGYQNRANHYMYNRAALASSKAEETDYLQKALNDMDLAMQKNPNKAEALFDKAKFILTAALSGSIEDERFSLTSALATIQQAIASDDSPIYQQLQGDIYFNMGDYQKAYDSYMLVNNSYMASTSSFYWAAKAKENIPGSNVFDIIPLLDNAVNLSIDNPTNETVVALWERGNCKLQIMLYDEAIADFDRYYTLLNAQVNDLFFYYREQAKFRKADYISALDDIQQALRLAPDNSIYLAEEAAIHIRLEDYDNAINSLQKAIAQNPDFADSHRLLGVCQVRKGNTAAACQSFHKAKELGDTVVDRLIQQYCGN